MPLQDCLDSLPEGWATRGRGTEAKNRRGMELRPYGSDSEPVVVPAGEDKSAEDNA